MTPGSARPGPARAAGLLAVGPFVLALLAGCASGPEVPGRPAPVPYGDTLPIAEPGEVEINSLAVGLGEATRDELGSTLSIRRAIDGTAPALNLTAFDEVVASSWYEHRITAPGGMTPAEVAEGAPGPAPTGTLTVVDGKVGGVTPGLTVEDGKGDTYLLKFDPAAFPGLGSGADVVASRLLWAAGYWTPKDVVVTVDPDALTLAPGAEIETDDEIRPMTRDDIRSAFDGVARRPDGRVRALASLFVPGTPKGPWRFQGRRADDPNDHYPHQHRRELRGLRVVASWLNHVDLSARNTMDVWIDPPGYLRHYLVDFGTTLGSGGIRALHPREGREYAFDTWASLGRLLTLGAYRVGWEGEDGTPIHPSLGWMQVEGFDPEAWKPFWPNEAFRRVTPPDGYWGAKRVAALDSAHVRAAVDAARYPDPVAADTLVDILMLRRDRVVEHWFGAVTPVESVRVEPAGPGELALSFEDLGVEHGVWEAEGSCWTWRVDEVEGGAEALRGASGRACGKEARMGMGSDPARFGVRIPLGSERDASWTAVVELGVERAGADDRPARIWLEGRGGDVGVAALRH